jgi:hypothetical protein
MVRAMVRAGGTVFAVKGAVVQVHVPADELAEKAHGEEDVRAGPLR